jgi:hypothetical protein
VHDLACSFANGWREHVLLELLDEACT